MSLILVNAREAMYTLASSTLRMATTALPGLHFSHAPMEGKSPLWLSLNNKAGSVSGIGSLWFKDAWLEI